MTSTLTAPQHGLLDSEFAALAKLAKTEFGLSLAESKKPLVASRLSRRLRARGLDGFQDYLALIRRPAEAEERLELISALTTNVTSFFREAHHFDALRTEVVPAMKAAAKVGRRARIWSAGCSSGQEAFSIAMTVLDAWPEALAHDVRILATDIDPKIVSRARNAVYSLEDLEAVPQTMRKYWQRLAQPDDDKGRITDDLKSLVTFAELNLILDWPFSGHFHAIFCRNVAIYFDKDTQQNLWFRLAERLEDNGLLCIGHSERLTGPAEALMQNRGITSYIKRPAPVANRVD